MDRYQLWHRLKGHSIQQHGVHGLFGNAYTSCSCGGRWVTLLFGDSFYTPPAVRESQL